jgi:hypothetical protein
MNDKKPYGFLRRRNPDHMVSKKLLLVLMCVCIISTIPVYTSASAPKITIPLNPSPAQGPYQDDEFLEKANATINSLSGKAVPNGTDLRELQSVQQQLAKMKISPEFYPVASDIYAFLYYTGKAGDEYGNALTMSSSLNIPASQSTSQFNEAENYYTAATEIWEGIREYYPEVILYKLSV